MDAQSTYNEEEVRKAIYDHIKGREDLSDTVKDHCTQEVVDLIMDTGNDLAEGAFIQGKGIKFRGLGTLKIVHLKERPYKTPDGNGGWLTGVTPAYDTVRFDASENLVQKMNNPLAE